VNRIIISITVVIKYLRKNERTMEPNLGSEEILNCTRLSTRVGCRFQQLWWVSFQDQLEKRKKTALLKKQHKTVKYCTMFYYYWLTEWYNFLCRSSLSFRLCGYPCAPGAAE